MNRLHHTHQKKKINLLLQEIKKRKYHQLKIQGKLKKRKVSADQPPIEKFSVQTQPTIKKRKIIEKKITYDSKGYEVIEDVEIEVEDNTEPIPQTKAPQQAQNTTKKNTY